MTDKQNYFTFIDNTSDNNSKIMEYLHKQINYEQNSVVIDDVDVSKCQHINAYNPKNPICQRGVGVGGSPSVCDARCRYADEYRYKQQLKRKEQECEELKKWKETAKDLFDKTCSCKYLNKENAHCSFYDKECVAINQCLYKNQQTLIEIKEFVENEMTQNGDTYIILQKISECEVE